jgi:hypothetical protein
MGPDIQEHAFLVEEMNEQIGLVNQYGETHLKGMSRVLWLQRRGTFIIFGAFVEGFLNMLDLSAEAAQGRQVIRTSQEKYKQRFGG